jgi:Zn finger protein HypA/HybF involved in hydrogenase expression
MHDYHAVSALVAHLTADAGLAPRVTEVRVKASAVFSPESLAQAYEIQTMETPLAGSRLVVEEAAEDRTCESCGSTWRLSRDDVAGHLVLCPSCGGLSPIDETAGLELLEVTAAEPARPASA